MLIWFRKIVVPLLILYFLPLNLKLTNSFVTATLDTADSERGIKADKVLLNISHHFRMMSLVVRLVLKARYLGWTERSITVAKT